MVFHAPYPLGERAGSGSGVRPVKMHQAFHDLGYDVIGITGYGAQRRRAVRELAGQLKDGLRVDFAYGENSTMPTVLTESHHLPTHPLVDLRLLHLCRRHGIPTGMFYRDVYWRFPEYLERVNRVVALGTRTLYHAELVAFRALDRVYLPSLQIADYVPHLRPGQAAALPPGGAVVDAPSTSTELTVLYVGNLSSYYRMQPMVRAVAQTPGVRMLLCTPPEAWEAVRGEYEQLLGDRVEVVHRRGEGLRGLFERSDVCSLVVEPSEYRDFASPVKLYEYLGYGKPVLASAGTLAAETVAGAGLGWSVPYDEEQVRALLTRLRDDRGEVAATTERVLAARHEHTWEARARQVAADLGSLDRRGTVEAVQR
ncbi:glycosyltransferase [Ornithinicoccus hortensis]|uniref:Glycosyltransferase involved in cell wall biosynthesis n=1 Tax=Ornithinicoccus hortensis TaxID=82346 RepID=A0A542YTJ9_9MICO|nr:glycosyltransferase [Ornithinicoccus hortensis]TQL51420.1 glycosyltransferase involved in cell wall biosynthesis [Ornithinicoccus hortensis]